METGVSLFQMYTICRYGLENTISVKLLSLKKKKGSHMRNKLKKPKGGLENNPSYYLYTVNIIGKYMNNKQKLVETIERISNQSGLSEGFLSNLLASKLKKWLKADPNVAKALKKAYDSAKDLEDAITSAQEKYPDLDIPSHLLKYVGKK
jgi:hypothetical protein